MSLRIDNLTVSFSTPEGAVRALRQVTLEIRPGERVALMGESGCGKTVLALALLGLLPRNASLKGSASLNGFNLLDASTVRQLRGREIALCWSNAERFFNPVVPVGRQIEEAYTLHHPAERGEARRRSLALLEEMGFADPLRVYRSYPFQLSGGMNQKAMLAMCVINSPRLLMVDEPTRGLDDLSRERVIQCLLSISACSLLVITHDAGLAEQLAHYACFMRAGEIFEEGPCPGVLQNPGHPSARELVRTEWR